jgi:integrase/recombinase XerD
MSRLYTNAPQQPLIDAINTLPVIAGWANAPWMNDPIGLAKQYVQGMGARNDLKAVQKKRS